MRINLLPPYLHQRKMVKLAMAVVVLVTIGEVATFILLRNGPLALQAQLTEQYNAENAELQRVQGLKAQSDTLLAGEAGLAPKYDFITNMMKYNEEYPDLYARVANYTYREAMMLNLEASANQLKFDAYVSEPRHVSILMLGLSRSPDFTGLPQITGVPGYDPAQDQERDAQAAGGLPGTTIIGGFGGADGGDNADSGAGGGLAAMGGGGSPYGGSAFGGGGGGNGPSGGMMGGMMGGGGALQAAGVSGTGSMGDMGGMMGGMMGGGGGGGTGDLSKLGLDAAVRKPKGFKVTVTCALSRNITKPTYGSSGQQTGGGAAGGFGGLGDFGGSAGMAGSGGGGMMSGNGP